MKLEEIKEAKTSREKFNFEKIDRHEFEGITPSSNDYEITEIDGKQVEVAYDSKTGNVIAMFFSRKNFGSKCLEFNSSDAVAYSELDPNWPWN